MSAGHGSESVRSEDRHTHAVPVSVVLPLTADAAENIPTHVCNMYAPWQNAQREDLQNAVVRGLRLVIEY